MTEVSCCRFGDQVLVGDEVLVHENDDLTPAEVTKISSGVKQGNHQT